MQGIEFGGASRDRTDDLIVANDALSQLSYSPFGRIELIDFTSLAWVRLDARSPSKLFCTSTASNLKEPG